MIITRDFNASTARQNEAIDALLSCGFYPSNIRLNNFDVEMQYNYKDILHEDLELVIKIYSSGQYKVIDYDGVCGVYTLREVIEYFQKGIAYGYWFEFNYQDNFTEEQIKNVTYLLLQDIKPVILERVENNVHLQYGFRWADNDCQIWNRYDVVIFPNGLITCCYQNKLCKSYDVVSAYDIIVAMCKMYPYKTFENKEEENKTMNNVMTMSDAVAMALSDDYKERFVAEYTETKIRYERLHNTIIKWYAGKSDFVTDSIELLEEQAKYMGNYLRVLEIRAVKEDIELPAVDWRK